MKRYIALLATILLVVVCMLTSFASSNDPGGETDAETGSDTLYESSYGDIDTLTLCYADEEEGDIAVVNGFVITENDSMSFIFPDYSVEEMEEFFIGYGNSDAEMVLSIGGESVPVG